MAGDIVRLARDHDRGTFDSGEPTLDRWFREHATQSERKDGTRTYVMCDATRVIGYYSLCTFSVDPDNAPSRTHLGRLPIPAILLARLAVDRSAQGQNVGSALLLDALTVAAHAAEQVAARLFVVHALHEQAARFYTHAGFVPFDADPLTLYLRMDDIRKTLSTRGLL